MSQEWIIRVEDHADHESIDRVVLAACGEEEVVDLVRKLRADADVLVSLVGENGSRVVGHIMMSRALIEDAGGDIPIVALAPLMVEPAYQNKGIGSLLTRAALQQCR